MIAYYKVTRSRCNQIANGHGRNVEGGNSFVAFGIVGPSISRQIFMHDLRLESHFSLYRYFFTWYLFYLDILVLLPFMRYPSNVVVVVVVVVVAWGGRDEHHRQMEGAD